MGATKMSDEFIIDTEVGIKSKVDDQELKILQLYGDNHPMLSQKIPEFSGKLPNGSITVLAKRLKMTMKLYNGMGLSANQCGVFERMFVMQHEGKVLVCINPKIVDESDDIQKQKEGCLSFPGMFVTVKRSKWIMAQWTDEEGNSYEGRMEGIPAIVFQHELDHLNGVKMVDYLGPVAKKMAKDKQMKLVKKMKRQYKKQYQESIR
jgi:peptide deformylase